MKFVAMEKLCVDLIMKAVISTVDMNVRLDYIA